MKCNILGCENEAEVIKKTGMASCEFCRKHFDEIYTGIKCGSIEEHGELSNVLKAKGLL